MIKSMGRLATEVVYWWETALALAIVAVLGWIAAGDELVIEQTTTTRFNVDLQDGGAVKLISRESSETRRWEGEPNPPEDPKPPTGDKWGLKKAAADLALRDGNAIKVAAAYELAATAVEDGDAKPADVSDLIDMSLRLLLTGTEKQKWDTVVGTLKSKVNALSLSSNADLVQALRHISEGLRSVGGGAKISAGEVAVNAVKAVSQSQGNAAFLDDLLTFIERFLPLLLRIIELFGGLS